MHHASCMAGLLLCPDIIERAHNRNCVPRPCMLCIHAGIPTLCLLSHPCSEAMVNARSAVPGPRASSRLLKAWLSICTPSTSSVPVVAISHFSCAAVYLRRCTDKNRESVRDRECHLNCSYAKHFVSLKRGKRELRHVRSRRVLYIR